MPFEVRPDVRQSSWLVEREGRRAARAIRVDAGGGETELARSERWRGLDRPALAAAVLADALGIEPSYRMGVDLAPFLIPEQSHGSKAMTAAELQTWVDTWKPPFERLFPGVEKRLRRQ